MDMDIFLFVVKCCIPAQVIRMDLEGTGNVAYIRIDQRLPVGCVVIISFSRSIFFK